MEKFNIICGLPRSGSTLLCNILNQNPMFYASSTSILPQLVANAISSVSSSMEVKGDLIFNRERAEKRVNESLKALCLAWHKREDGRNMIFDKSRGWAHNILALRKIFPESKVLVIVRDLRNIFASIEKQHQKNPLFDQSPNPTGKTLFGRADTLFSPKGMIGSPIEGIEDMIRRKLPVMMLKYEQLCKFPNEVMAEIYQYLEEPLFIHDFKDVKNTAEDVDALYYFKFPHKGTGEVKPGDPEEWKKFMTEDMANTIMARFPLYNSYFGYE